MLYPVTVQKKTNKLTESYSNFTTKQKNLHYFFISYTNRLCYFARLIKKDEVICSFRQL